VTYVIEFRELPHKEWQLLDYNIPEPVCKVRNLELGKSYQFRVRAENIYGISDPSPASPPSRLMARPPPVLDKNKRVIPILDPYAERALELAHAEQYACSPWLAATPKHESINPSSLPSRFAPGVPEKRFVAENDHMSISLHFNGYPDPKITWKHRGYDVDGNNPTSNMRCHSFPFYRYNISNCHRPSLPDQCFHPSRHRNHADIPGLPEGKCRPVHVRGREPVWQGGAKFVRRNCL
jgi:hypothetical protein